jgi:hypothetical protein
MVEYGGLTVILRELSINVKLRSNILMDCGPVAPVAPVGPIISVNPVIPVDIYIIYIMILSILIFYIISIPIILRVDV